VGLIAQTKARIVVAGATLLACWGQADGFARGDPIKFVAGTDAILICDRFLTG
jgi:hypothetical protein